MVVLIIKAIVGSFIFLFYFFFYNNKMNTYHRHYESLLVKNAADVLTHNNRGIIGGKPQVRWKYEYRISE